MINPFIIIKKVEAAYFLSPGTLVSSGRRKTVSEARAVAIYLSREFNDYSWPEIASHFDRADHNSMKKAAERVRTAAQESQIRRMAEKIFLEILNENSVVTRE